MEAGGFEAVLHGIAPGATPIRVVTQGSQSHAKITRWQNIHFLTDHAGGTAVVGNSYDRGDFTRNQSQSEQRGIESVTPTQGGDFQIWSIVSNGCTFRTLYRGSRQLADKMYAHSRPKSRWEIMTFTP